MTGKIFINYRRGDDPGNTGRLFDRLEEAFSPEQLFMDVDNIAPGLDFIRVLEDQVRQCDVLLAVIGPRWFDATDQHGSRRLEDPNDFVLIEIASALSQDKLVIPVLVGQTQMPRPDELPEAIRPLARRNAVRLTHERFRTDAQGLVKVLQQALREAEAVRQEKATALDPSSALMAFDNLGSYCKAMSEVATPTLLARTQGMKRSKAEELVRAMTDPVSIRMVKEVIEFVYSRPADRSLEELRNELRELCLARKMFVQKPAVNNLRPHGY